MHECMQWSDQFNHQVINWLLTQTGKSLPTCPSLGILFGYLGAVSQEDSDWLQVSQWYGQVDRCPSPRINDFYVVLRNKKSQKARENNESKLLVSPNSHSAYIVLSEIIDWILGGPSYRWGIGQSTEKHTNKSTCDCMQIETENHTGQNAS